MLPPSPGWLPFHHPLNTGKEHHMQLSEMLAKLDTKGGDYALNTRNRLRTSYVAAKIYGKSPDWTPADDKAFDDIDAQTVALVKNAGMMPPPLPAVPTLENANEDDFRAEAVRRGFMAPAKVVRPAVPATPPAAPALPGNPASLKPEGFA